MSHTSRQQGTHPRKLTPLTVWRHERYMEGQWLYV
jgi:hypothetical protein